MRRLFSFSHKNVSRFIRYFSSKTPEPVELTFKVFESTPPLLMFHGMYGSKSNFNSIAKKLTENTNPKRRVFTIDQRNHGYSPHNPDHTYEALAEDIRALMTKLGLEKAALLGHSMGGKVVLYFSLKYPSLVDRLIVSDISHVTDLGDMHIQEIIGAMLEVKIPPDFSHGMAMKTADEQMQRIVTDKWFRRFLLVNLKRHHDGNMTSKSTSPRLFRLRQIGKYVMSGAVFGKASSTDREDTEDQNADVRPVKIAYKLFDDMIPPILMFHGFMESKSNLSRLARRFQLGTDPKRCVFTVDIRNHGHSQQSSQHSYEHIAVDIKTLMDELRLDKVCLFGHSMGGKGVLYFALKYPELVDRLVISDVSHVTDFRKIKLLQNLYDTLYAIKDMPFPTSKRLQGAMEFLDQLLVGMIPEQWLRKTIITNLRQKDNGTFYWRLNIDALLKNKDRIVSFPDVKGITYDGHVLFLAGSESPFIQQEDVPEIKRLCPKAEVKFIAGAGHLIHVDKPKEFEEACLEFLNRPLID